MEKHKRSLFILLRNKKVRKKEELPPNHDIALSPADERVCVCLCVWISYQKATPDPECALTLGICGAIERVIADVCFLSTVRVIDTIRLDASLLVFILLVDTYEQKK